MHLDFVFVYRVDPLLNVINIDVVIVFMGVKTFVVCLVVCLVCLVC